MEITERLKQIASSSAILGLTFALFLSGLAFGLGAGWQTVYKDNKIFAVGWNPYRNMAVTYFIISVCLLLFIVLIWKGNNVLLKAAGFIPLAVILLQCRILIIFKPAKLPDWVIAYSDWLGLMLYMDFFFLALAIVLLILQLYSIWHVYRSSANANP